MTALTESVAPSWGANKKLASLVQTKLATVPVKKVASFLQLGRTDSSSREPVRKAMNMVSVASGRIGSSVLAMLAVRMEASEDRFEKVRSLIRDLLTRLKDDA